MMAMNWLISNDKKTLLLLLRTPTVGPHSNISDETLLLVYEILLLVTTTSLLSPSARNLFDEH